MITLRVSRKWFGAKATVGELYINDGDRDCFTLEDVARPAGIKVPGATAIPVGIYKVIVDRSERFSRKAGHSVYLPHVLDVPNFDGIRIHSGNTDVDTEGCILLGETFRPDGVFDFIGNSKAALAAFMTKIARATGTGDDGAPIFEAVDDIELRVEHAPADTAP